MQKQKKKGGRAVDPPSSFFSFLALKPLTLLREFSQEGNISADDTLVKMKVLQRSVDVAVIDS